MPANHIGAATARPSPTQKTRKIHKIITEVACLPQVRELDLTAAAEKFESHIEVATQGTPHTNLGSMEGGIINRLIDRYKAIGTMTKLINAAWSNVNDREESLSESLVHIAMLGSSAEQEGGEYYFTSLYQRTHFDPVTNTSTVSLPQWFQRLHPYYLVDARKTPYPNAEVYLKESRDLAGEYTGILSRIADINKDLKERREIKERADARGQGNSYGVGIAKLEAEVSSLVGQYPELLARVTDVLPERVAALNSVVTGNVTVRPEIIDYLLKGVVATEALLQGVLLSKESKDVQVPMVHFMDDGAVLVETATVSAEEVASIAGSPEKKATLLRLVIAGRELVKDLIPALEVHESSREIVTEGIRVCNAPFSRELDLYNPATRALCADQNPEVIREIIKLFSDPITVKYNSDLYALIERFDQIEPLHFLVRHALLHDDGAIAQAANRVVASVPEFSHGAEIIQLLREPLRQRRYAEVIKCLTAEISTAGSQRHTPTTITLLCLLHCLASDSLHATRLKKQISNLRDVRTPVAELTTQVPALQTDIERCLDEVIKGLTATLGDYYHGPGMEELYEAVEKYRILCEEPTILNGVEGDEGMRSGVLLIGEPGLGKTSLVEALEGELGVKCFKIVPVSEDLASPAQLLSTARRTIEEVKRLAQNGKPCMFFIDEAESLMRSRKDPLSSIEQKTLTCYFLQEICEIRRKFPRVFLVAATNYIDEIDEGIVRQGRYDIHVFYGKPDAHMRKNIIVGTLGKAQIDASFSTAELEELMAVTDGLKPLSIKQTIIDLHRFGPLLAKRRGESFVFDFNALKFAYEKESARLARSESALAELKKRHRPTSNVGSLVLPQ